MISKYFTDSEARQKIGKKVRTNVDFAGIPKGTTGKVTGKYTHSDGDVGLDITWDVPQNITDGFSKDEYDDFIVEM